MRRALYTGSFDPMTIGHLDIITRASGMFDELVVGVIVNPQKKPMFTKEERVEMIREVTAHLPNVSADSFQGLLADYVNENGFDVVIRGLRAASDFEYELTMAHVNARLFKNGTESVFLMTEPSNSYISSSVVREVASLHGDIEGMVPPQILDRIIDKCK